MKQIITLQIREKIMEFLCQHNGLQFISYLAHEHVRSIGIVCWTGFMGNSNLDQFDRLYILCILTRLTSFLSLILLC